MQVIIEALRIRKNCSAECVFYIYLVLTIVARSEIAKKKAGGYQTVCFFVLYFAFLSFFVARM